MFKHINDKKIVEFHGMKLLVNKTTTWLTIDEDGDIYAWSCEKSPIVNNDKGYGQVLM